MKTIKTMAVAIVVVLAVSCGTYNRMVTTIDDSGSVLREIYAIGDSAFLAGDMTANPFLFNLTPHWAVTRFDSAIKFNSADGMKNFNVKISRSLPSIDQFSAGLTFDQDKRSFAVPEESLTEKFCWFYTYYTFTATYKKMDYVTPVSIDRYLTKAEQKLWSQGDEAIYRTMNGIQLNKELSSIDEKFMEWYARNSLEISADCIERLSGDRITQADRDKIRNLLIAQKQIGGITPRVTCDALDDLYKTDRYSKLYKANPTLDSQFESATGVIEQLGHTISYSLALPSRALTTNALVVDSTQLTWSVDGMRLLFDNYTLRAEYRVANVWAFVVSGLIFVLVVGSIVVLVRKKR